MAVQAGWVGTSAKAETGKGWMSEARLELRLPKAGWMSEMVGKSTEVKYTNTTNRTQANIHTLMGSPTVPNIYVFENTATITASTQGGWALQTGSFPAGSTLKIINRGSIRGGGGDGGTSAPTAGSAGGSALVLNFPTTIDNTSGTIWGGGGGGGGRSGDTGGGGGGGAGSPAGRGGTDGGYGGTATAGGSGGAGGGVGGAAGAAGAAGTGIGRAQGGRGGYSVQRNGHAVTWIAVGDRKGSVV